ncbi:MAG: 50S ribosomal protein L9 [Bacteroidales bacterium]|nr:50S ribosomal protein L9 [Bacteroidales bacterium]
MEVILKQDIAKLGFTNDIITVKDGYARNYLIPNGLATLATPSAKKVLAENHRQRAHKEEKIRKDAMILAQAIEASELTITARVGESGKIFGSITSQQVSDALKAQANLSIDRKKIEIKGDSIKELGSFTATATLHKEVSATIQFKVVAE